MILIPLPHNVQLGKSMPRKRPTAVRIDPLDADEIQNLIDAGQVKDISNFIRDAIKEKLSEYRVSADVDPETMTGIRHLIEIGVYDSIEEFTREAARRHLYLTKDKEMIREALFTAFLDDPRFKAALREFIHTVVVEGFAPSRQA